MECFESKTFEIIYHEIGNLHILLSFLQTKIKRAAKNTSEDYDRFPGK